MLTERTQVFLSKQQVTRLRRIAVLEGRSVAAVIREAVDAYTTTAHDPRRQAREELFALEAPIADWPTLKEEIVAGAMGSEARGPRSRGSIPP